jgi:hypothetical protein
MKKIFLIQALLLLMVLNACKKADFASAYVDPAKINSTTVAKQFAGFVKSNSDYVLPSYWNYFVILRITLDPYNQAIGWANVANQYVPGAAAINDRWNAYYNFLAQYRELQKVNGQLSATEQTANRIFMIASTIYLYDHTEKVVDLHGDIPFSKAGMLSTNNGDYANSYPAYDKAEDVYTKMLDDLKAFSAELNTISPDAGVAATFKNQDLINQGDITKWKKYCNSLRLKMLTRVSSVASFQARVSSEISSILTGASSATPIVASNNDNIQMQVYNVGSDINSTGFRSGLEDWNGNLAGKQMIDHMNTNADPRLRVMFEPGATAAGIYKGLDPMLDASSQNTLINGGAIAIYNRSTLSRNQFFPGALINAAEVSFLVAEYYLGAGNDAAAKTAYETGIKQSIDYYYKLRTISNDNTVAAPSAPTVGEISNYLASAGVSWSGAATNAAKLTLIATQKWLHYSVVQPNENWAETRRLDAPTFNFLPDNSSIQKTPPMRWLYPSSENTYNTANYNVVKAKDNLTTKIFWDTK